jgi:cytochrome b561
MVMDRTYTKTAIMLHWLIALMIFTAVLMGFYVTSLSVSPQKLKWIAWHKWLGVSIFFLMLFRLGWRLRHPAPELPLSMPLWERQMATAVHIMLYVLMLCIPLSGWLFSSAAGFPVVFLGYFQLPDLVAKNRELALFFKQAHLLFNLMLLGLLGGHIGAALKHHFVLHDGILIRMLPWLKQGKSS